MAYGNFVLDKGYNAGSAISKYRCVRYTGTEEVSAVTAINQDIAGVAQFAVTETERTTRGKGSSVRVEGITEVEAGGAIAVGDRCELMADGRVKVAVAASGARLVGKCVGSPAAGAGERIAMLIIQGGPLM